MAAAAVAAPAAAGMGPLGWLALGSTILGAGGILGDLFGEDETEKLLRERMKGIDPKILADMRRRARSAIGNQGMAERVSTEQRLGRAGAPIAKRQEISDKIRTRQFGAIGDALSDIDIANEQYKSGAMTDLAGYTERRDANKGMGYASSLSSGLNYFMNNKANFDEELERIGSKANQYSRFRFPSVPQMNMRPDFYMKP